MPKECVTKNLKTMGLAGAVKKCYPKATKAAKSAIAIEAYGYKIARHIVKRSTKKEIAMSKPKKLSLRRDVPEMEKRRRRTKAKSMKKDRSGQASVPQSSSKKKYKRKHKHKEIWKN